MKKILITVAAVTLVAGLLLNFSAFGEPGDIYTPLLPITQQATTSSETGTEQNTEQNTEKNTESASEGVTEPTTEKVTEPVTEPATERVTEPVTKKEDNTLPTADTEYEASGVPFTEFTTGSSGGGDIAPAPVTVKKPKATKIIKLTKGKKCFKVKWKKVKGVKGYQIQYSTKKSFKKKFRNTLTVKKAKTVKRTVKKKVVSGKKYYVRVRTYKIVNGKKVYSKWSKVKAVRVK